MIENGEDPVMRHDAALGEQDLAVAIDHVDRALREQHATCAVSCGNPRVLIDDHRKREAVLCREGRVRVLVCRVDPKDGNLPLLELRPIIAQGAKLLGADRRVVLRAGVSFVRSARRSL